MNDLYNKNEEENVKKKGRRAVDNEDTMNFINISYLMNFINITNRKPRDDSSLTEGRQLPVYTIL